MPPFAPKTVTIVPVVADCGMWPIWRSRFFSSARSAASTELRSVSGLTGRGRKSFAPAIIALRIVSSSRVAEYTMIGVSGANAWRLSMVWMGRSMGSETPMRMTSGWTSAQVEAASMPKPHSPAMVRPEARTTCFASKRAWMSASTISVDGVFAMF